MKVAQAISAALEGVGVHDVFGNPGTTELPFLEGLSQRYVLSLHDSIAVAAADGFATGSGRLAFVNLHAAPGLGNAMGFLETAMRHRSPLLVTVGQQDLRHRHLDPLLQGDFVGMARIAVKSAVEVESPSDAAGAIARAVRAALTPPRGPVLVSLPMDVVESEAPTAFSIPAGEGPHPAVVPPPVVAALRQASSPALVAGYEVDASGAFDELSRLAELLGAPIFAEPLASRAMVRANEPAYAGDLLPASALISSALGDYDPIVLVGSDLTVYPYTPSPLLPGKQVIYLGNDPATAAKLAGLSALGDLKSLLGSLLPQLAPSGRPPFRRPRDFARANRIARAARVMGGEYILDAALRAFPDHAVVDEAVSQTPTLKSCGAYRGPKSYFGCRSGQLGWALGSSIGLGLTLPKVLVIVGDGAFQYTVQSLWTLAKYRLPVKVLVINNHGYNILRSYSKAYHAALTDAPYLSLPLLDVESEARGFGLPARTVPDAPSLEGGLQWLHDEPGPALLNVEMDRTVPNLFS